jgi:MoxR-like ATPase
MTPIIVTPKLNDGQKRTTPVLLERIDGGKGYIFSSPLAAAVDVALLTGMPLLVTGEPGTGKSKLAEGVSDQLGLPLLRFDTKSTSIAQDLLYHFDLIGRFYDAEMSKLGKLSEADRNPKNPAEYVSFRALGAAIVLASAEREMLLARYIHGLAGMNSDGGALTNTADCQRCIVLIDEIDKAPRDFPNDLLNELDHMQFRLHETNQEIKASHANRPIVIITSNAERDLPEPFLRRCAFFHIETDAKNIEAIVVERLGELSPRMRAALDHFHWIGKQTGLQKKPSVAELLVWLQLLNRLEVPAENFEPQNYEVLFKIQDDADHIRKLWKERK